jgi:TetR/AcrR family transcriptional regulator, regulator of autoinduction and epiphytic fitness
MTALAEPRKRIRRDPDTTRALILDTTERLMVEEGYAAVSTRRIALELGLNAATIHYYYPTTDDVFIALHHRMSERQLAELEKVLDCADPVRALWQFQSGWGRTALGVEFLALANHRKAIGDVLAASTNASRAAAAAAIERTVGQLSLGSVKVPPVALGTILVAVGRLLANEGRVGISSGHGEVRCLIDALIDKVSS